MAPIIMVHSQMTEHRRQDKGLTGRLKECAESLLNRGDIGCGRPTRQLPMGVTFLVLVLAVGLAFADGNYGSHGGYGGGYGKHGSGYGTGYGGHHGGYGGHGMGYDGHHGGYGGYGGYGKGYGGYGHGGKNYGGGGYGGGHHGGYGRSYY
ncbi:uncharacterized protein LOC144094573 isoform X1 [Amblyomma americanum]